MTTHKAKKFLRSLLAELLPGWITQKRLEDPPGRQAGNDGAAFGAELPDPGEDRSSVPRKI